MELIVINSSSAGNGYILKASNEVLLLEAGVHFKEVQKHLDYDVKGIVGTLVSHRHGDHSMYIKEYEKYSDVYAPESSIVSHKVKEIEPLRQFTLGDFKILPFEVQHDVKTFGYLINHEESGNILFATDTYFLKYTFPGLNHILIEANYCEHILDENIKSGKISPAMKSRVFQSHMNINTTIKTLRANDLTKVVNVVLIHLSAGNSNEKQFIDRVKAEVGTPYVFAATRGMKLKLDESPF